MKTPTVDEQLLSIISDAKSRKNNFDRNDNLIDSVLNSTNNATSLYYARLINNRTLKDKISKAASDSEKIAIVKEAQKNINKFSLNDSFISGLLNTLSERDILNIINYGYDDHVYDSSSNTSIY